MGRHASWFPLVAIALIVVGLVTLAAPPPAQAFDPQLALALASAAGAIALITGYLIVSNAREKERSASFGGIYTCRDAESAGPMGCGGPSRPTVTAAAPRSDGPMSADVRTASQGASMPVDGPMVFASSSIAAVGAFQSAASPMMADDRFAAQSAWFACPGGQAAGPMGCGGPMSSPTSSSSAASASAPAPSLSPYQGQ
jgi:hypothetical protein